MSLFVLFRVGFRFQFVPTDCNREGTREDAKRSPTRKYLIAILLLTPLITAAQPRPADLVVISANIRTVVSRDARAEALAVSGNRISAVGTNKQITRFIGPKTRVIDAKGKLVLPGFNDAHVHFLGIGNSFSAIDLRGLRTPDAIAKRFAHYVRYLPAGRWILGRGWDDATPLDRKTIENITPHHPVFVYHVDGQAAFANDNAFKLAGLKRGDGIERNRDGEPTGIVRGDAMKRIAHAIPADHTRRWSEVAETATNFAASMGVTSVQDTHSDDSREIYRELHRLGKLKTRIYDCVPLPDWRKLEGTRNVDDMIRGGCLKSFTDGDEGSAERLLRDIIPADKAHLQILIHAIGNAANGNVLEVFEKVEKTNGARDRRLRVEHAHNPRVEDLPRFSRSKIVASMQPYLFGSGYYRRLLGLNAVVAFGSDAAMTELNPLLAVHTAVNSDNEPLTVYEAVRAYTVGSAYAEFQEKQKGTIETGKLADFVILSDDIFTIDPIKIREVSVIMTVVDGRIVYEAN